MTNEISKPVWFQVIDNLCKALSVHVQPDCDFPDTLKAKYLDYILIVTKTDTRIGEGYFSFEYANGVYSTGNNACGCSNSVAESLTTVRSCIDVPFLLLERLRNGVSRLRREG